MDVERLLQWAYAEECVGAWRGGKDFFAELTGAGSNAEAIMRHLALGTMVDGGGASAVAAPEVPADAVVVHEVVSALPRDVRRVVMVCALRRERPEAYVGISARCVPVLAPSGKPLVEYRRPAKREEPYLCWVAYEPSPVEILEARMVYTRWHMALEDLAAGLGGRLERFEVVGPFAPAEPWALDRGVES